MDCVVTVRTLCATTAFFYDHLSGAQDLDLHGLAPQRSLELPDLGVGLAQLAGGTTSSLACTAVVAPASANRFQLRITLGAMSSSRLSSATVFSPATTRWTVARLNSVVNTRRPSALRRCSPMGPPAASYVPAVSSRNGEHSTAHAGRGGGQSERCSLAARCPRKTHATGQVAASRSRREDTD